MKIILFIHQSAEMYGSDKVMLYLAQGLKNGNVFNPVVVLPERGALHVALLASGIEVHIGEVAKISRAVFSPSGLVRLAWQMVTAVRSLDRIVAGRHIAVVHSNTLAVLAGAVWSVVRRQKHLWHVHEIILTPKLVSKAFPYLVNRLSDRSMSNSTLTEQWLLSAQPTLADRSVVVFNGLPVVDAPSANATNAFRQRIGASAEDVVITLAGRINRWKGHELLLEAAACLKRSGRAALLRFVIVGGTAPGSEDLPSKLQAMAAAGGFEGQCSFVPFVDDIWPVWFGTDIAVVPSTEPEPFGMVAIEAMAAGVPVVAAKHGGLLDIVVHQETGLHFTPRDVGELAEAIDQLASDQFLRRKLGLAGSKRQRDLFSVDSQVSKTSKTYEEMLA